jgi:hypothetical protein
MKNNCWDGNKVILAILVACICSSCSTIVYRSKGRIPATFDKSPKHHREVILKGEKDFYLWGLIPNRHYVYIDEIAKESGLTELSRIEIYERNTFKNTILTAITFGLYTPTTYHVEGMTYKK